MVGAADGPGNGVGLGAALALGAAHALGGALALGVAEEGGAAITLLTMLAVQATRLPPPLPEPLHWLTVTSSADVVVPVARQLSPTRVPPFAEPLHWVIVALVVFAG